MAQKKLALSIAEGWRDLFKNISLGVLCALLLLRSEPALNEAEETASVAVKMGKISAKNRPKAMVAQNKNKKS